MRFIGLVLVLSGFAVGYYLVFRDLTFDQARTRLAQLLNLPGLASSSPRAAGSAPAAGGSGGSR